MDDVIRNRRHTLKNLSQDTKTSFDCLARVTLEYFNFDMIRCRCAMIDELQSRIKTSGRNVNYFNGGICEELLVSVFRKFMKDDTDEVKEYTQKDVIEENEIRDKYNDLRKECKFSNEFPYEDTLVKDLFFEHNAKFTTREIRRRVIECCTKADHLRKLLTDDAKMVIEFYESDIQQNKCKMLDDMCRRNVHLVDVDRRFCENVLDEVYERLDELHAEFKAKQFITRSYIKDEEILETYTRMNNGSQFDEESLAKALFYAKHKHYTSEEIIQRVHQFCALQQQQNIFNQFEPSLQTKVTNATKMVFEYVSFDLKQYKATMVQILHNLLRNVDDRISQEFCNDMIDSMASQCDSMEREMRDRLNRRKRKKPITDTAIENKFVELTEKYKNKTKSRYENLLIRELFFDYYVHGYTLEEIHERYSEYKCEANDESDAEERSPQQQPLKQRRLNR